MLNLYIHIFCISVFIVHYLEEIGCMIMGFNVSKLGWCGQLVYVLHWISCDDQADAIGLSLETLLYDSELDQQDNLMRNQLD